MRSGSATTNASEKGFTYLVMLFAVAAAGAMAAAGSVVWQQDSQRQREQELLRIGNEFRYAIALYYHRTPGSVQRYPESLEALLRDDRHLSLERHLRRIYADPITGRREWGLVPAPQGGIRGVYSLSDKETVKRNSFAEADAAFAGQARYADWKFVYVPPPTNATPRAPGPASR